MSCDLIKELSTLTTLPASTLGSLVSIGIDAICYDVLENSNVGENVSEINIGIGTLSILVDDNQIRYKFLPSDKLESSLVSAVVSGENPLVRRIENKVREKLSTATKELL